LVRALADWKPASVALTGAQLGKHSNPKAASRGFSFSTGIWHAQTSLPPTATEKISFGKHKGTAMMEVIKNDRPYCCWVLEMEKANGANRTALNRFAECIRLHAPELVTDQASGASKGAQLVTHSKAKATRRGSNFSTGTWNAQNSPSHKDPAKITFGKHRGETMMNLLKTDKAYCCWVLAEEKTNGGKRTTLSSFAEFIRLHAPELVTNQA